MKHFTLFLLLWLAFSAAPAHAQQDDGGFNFPYGQSEEEDKDAPPFVNQYSKKYKNPPKAAAPAPDSEEPQQQSLLPRGVMYMYFVRTGEERPGDATLRMLYPMSVTGCMNVLQPIVTGRRVGTSMLYKFQDADIALDRTARYAQFDCKNVSGYASTDLTLNRLGYRNNGIKQIVFEGDYGSDTYLVEVSETKISLLPKTMRSFKPFDTSGKADPLAYNFYPDNTVVLAAPAAKPDAPVAEALQAFADAHGLVDLKIDYPELALPLKNGASAYFIDQKGEIGGVLEAGKSVKVGDIVIPVDYTGPEGTYQRDRNYPVFARKPGFLD